MTQTLKLSFSKNWNGKLGCDAFGTVRLDGEYYQAGRLFDVWLGDDFLGTAQVQCVYRLKLAEISDRIAWFDVGKPVAYLRTLLERMYQNKGINWDTQVLVHVILEWKAREPQFPLLLAKAGPKSAQLPVVVNAPPKPVQASLGLDVRVNVPPSQNAFTS